VKIRPFGAEFLYADGRTDMMKRILAFRKFEQSTLKTGIHGILYERKFRFSKDTYMARYVITETKNDTENKIKSKSQL